MRASLSLSRPLPSWHTLSLSCSLTPCLSLPLLPPLLLLSFMSKSQVVISDARATRAVWKHWSTKVKTTSTTTCQGLDRCWRTKTGGGKIKVSELEKWPQIHCSYFVKSLEPMFVGCVWREYVISNTGKWKWRPLKIGDSGSGYLQVVQRLPFIVTSSICGKTNMKRKTI